MIRHVYIDPGLDKQLQTLRRAGKKAVLAANKVDRILSRIKVGALRYEQIGKPTKHGEWRIKGCMKYDLGSGYRLVALKQGADLLILYVGSHDDCHRWIENNQELSLSDIRQRSQSLHIKRPYADGRKEDTQDKDLDREVVGVFAEELDDRTMRTLFSGLIQSVQNHL